MLTSVARAFALIQIILAAAAAAVPGAAKTVQYIEPAVAKANAAIAALTGLVPITNAQSALDDLAAAVTALHQQGLVPANASTAPIEQLILSTDAALHNYISGQAVPIAPLSVEGKKGFLYAIPDGSTVSDALGR